MPNRREVASGVLQGSVLGPLLFLIYINDINLGTDSNMRLFTDDYIVYRKIDNEMDVLKLQADLERICKWCSKWKMNLNAGKCIHVRFAKKKTVIDASYYLMNNVLSKKFTTKYLGVLLGNCSWWAPVDYVVGKAAVALNYIQINLKCANSNLRSTTYLSCVRPI